MSAKILDPMSICLTPEHAEFISQLKEQMRDLYSENRPITDGAFDESLATTCVNGTFVGRKSTDNTIVFRGIPYVGKQPTGNLRFKAPTDVIPDDGVYEAYYNGKVACQREIEPSSAYPMGEDCLYLNIWKAAGTKPKRPVMVWVHGGGFEIGGTVDPGYDFTNFVEENPDVIVVSVCYRLGALGFLYLAHLEGGKDYADAANLGLLDQVQALKWVHNNIAAFGGDPDNVTIFGESAGAGSVTLIPLIEGSHAYFRRLIAESGTPAMTKSKEQAIACTNAIMDILGVTSVHDLVKVDATELVRAAGEVASLQMFPIRDGKILPEETLDAYAAGAAKDLEILVGCNKDEMNCYVQSMGIDAYLLWGNDLKAKKLAQITDEEKAKVESYCADVVGDTYEHVSRLLDQTWFIAPVFRLSENQTAAGGKAYTYLFTVESSVPLAKSGHGMELTCVLNHPEMSDSVGRVIDETFSKTMRRMWVQFATCGDPSLDAEASPDGTAKAWPLYDPRDRNVMIFDEFDIHVEKESVRKIVDWDRTYGLTKYYLF